ncbi:MAG TPA: SRPBCC domain-containing protein [Burkholderiales bacterium]|nr:SRPBCC domain-containing protein [Burkholderiales bacterium]
MKSLMSRGRGSPSRSLAPPRAAIRIARRFSVPPADVFGAWLDPELARQWLFATASRPMTHVEIDPRVEGFFRFAEQRDGELIEYTGHYVEIIPDRRLVFTLSMEEHWYVTTRVTVEITAMKTGCQLSLLHDDVPSHYADCTEGRWAGMLYGLDVTLAGKRGL